MTTELTNELIKQIALGVIGENFLVKSIEEKSELVPKELHGKEVVRDGFMNPVVLQTFPLKDKAVYLSVRRRRWKEKGSQGSGFSNNYDLYRQGIKTTKEFGDFLQEKLRSQPAQYNQHWGSPAH
jgi:hypothetical protein